MPWKSVEPNNGSDPPDPPRLHRSGSRLTVPATPGVRLDRPRSEWSSVRPKGRQTSGSGEVSTDRCSPWSGRTGNSLAQKRRIPQAASRSNPRRAGSELKGHSLVFERGRSWERNRCQMRCFKEKTPRPGDGRGRVPQPPRCGARCGARCTCETSQSDSDKQAAA